LSTGKLRLTPESQEEAKQLSAVIIVKRLIFGIALSSLVHYSSRIIVNAAEGSPLVLSVVLNQRALSTVSNIWVRKIVSS